MNLVFFLYIFGLICVIISKSAFETRNFRDQIRFNPIKKELSKSQFNGKFKETFHEIQIPKNGNELQENTLNKGNILRNELREQIRKSRFNIGSNKDIAKDLSWIQVDPYGNQNEFDLNENDISNLLNNIQNEMHSYKSNYNYIYNDFIDERRRRTYVMGNDDRIPINYIDHSPPIHVALIKFKSIDNSNNNGGYNRWLNFGSWYGSRNNARQETWQQCTGTLIGPRHILTAGHCVHEGSNGDWYGDFRIYIGGENGDDSDYYGWSNIKAVSCWINDGDFDCDFGLIILDKEPNIGYMQIGYNNDIDTNMWFVAFGYPTRTDSQLWLTGCYLWEISPNNIRDTQCDIEPGQSGSALSTWIQNLQTRIIYGVISNENYIQTSNGWYSNKQYFNQHTRITPFVYTTICNWIQNDGYYDVC